MENINERRLRPVFDNLELGNNKKAIQEADKVLKKSPNIQCGRALKALALLRLGRAEEAEPFIEALCTEKPCDVSTLQVMTFYYRETEELDKICTLYSNAVNACPGNEELMSHLFMSYVRINDYKQQQTAALQLYKFRPKNPYYFWAVMSVVLQALRGPDAGDKGKVKLLLALAQRMVDKLIKEDKLDAEQEVELYLSILKHQEKYEDALTFFDSDFCKRLYPGAPISIKIDLLKLLNKWRDLNSLLEGLLLEDNDRWDYYLEYIGSCFELDTAGEKSNEESFINTCSEFLKKMIETNPKVRGPRLAQMELHRLIREKRSASHDATSLLGDYTDLLVSYYATFGDRTCCTYDLKKFLEHMEAHKRPGFASRLLQDCGIAATPLPETQQQMQRHICALQISRICGAHAALSSDHLQALYTALSLHYEHGFNAFGGDLLSTDFGPSDSYALLAVNVMYDLALRTQSSDKLVEALCLLSYLLNQSPSNFHAKLQSLQLYHVLGCGTGAHQVYQSLDVKQIQLDSMGYLHCAHLPSLGLPSVARQMYDATQKFFASSHKDTLEYLAMCYKFGSFSKLQEFMRFRDRLSNSFHAALVSVESQLLELVLLNGNFAHNASVYRSLGLKPDDDRISWDGLSDNRDLTVVGRWDPAFPYTDEAGKVVEPDAQTNKLRDIEKESFVQDIELLQIRSGLLRLVGAMFELITQGTPAGTESAKDKLQYHSKILTILRNYWLDLFSRIQRMGYKPTPNTFLVNLIPSRLHLMLQLPLESFFSLLADFVLRLYGGESRTKDLAAQLIEKVFEIVHVLKTTVTEHSDAEDLIWGRRNVQAVVSGLIEILSLGSFVVSAAFERYSASLASNQPKKGKKKDPKGTPNGVLEGEISEAERLVIVTDVIRELKKGLVDCDAILDKWKQPSVTSSLTESLSALSLNPSVEGTVSGTIKENHVAVVKELKQILKDKIKMTNK